MYDMYPYADGVRDIDPANGIAMTEDGEMLVSQYGRSTSGNQPEPARPSYETMQRPMGLSVAELAAQRFGDGRMAMHVYENLTEG